MFTDQCVVDGVVVGDDECRVALAQRLRSQRGGFAPVLFGDEGVVVADTDALDFEQPPGR